MSIEDGELINSDALLADEGETLEVEMVEDKISGFGESEDDANNQAGSPYDDNF